MTITDQNRVVIFDTTLRDGEQSPGISLDVAEKVEIAEQLARLGVDYIEAGFPIASQGDFEAVRAVAQAVGTEDGPVICGLSRTARKDIDRCWEAIEPAARRRIHTFIATSETHMVHKLRMTPDQVLSEAAAAVAHARQYTDDVEFSPEDASRSDFDFMCEVLRAAVEAGATTLNIPDTVGFGIPEEYGRRLAAVRDNVPGDYVIIGPLSRRPGSGGGELARRGRARGAAGGVCDQRNRRTGGQRRAGGDRHGVAHPQRPFRWADHGGADRGAGALVPPGQPSDRIPRAVQQGRGRPQRVRPRGGYPPARRALGAHDLRDHGSGIGRTGRVEDRSGKAFGSPRVRRHAGEDGHRGPAATRSTQAFARFKELADRKIQLTEADLEAIVAEELGTRTGDRWEIASIAASVTPGGAPEATVVLTHEDETFEQTCEGDGMVDACCSAIKKITGMDGRLADYTVASVTGGVDALADVVLQFTSDDGITVAGRGLSTDVVEASARAFLNAINKVIVARSRGDDGRDVIRPGSLRVE